jgi:hypothetical protein
MKEKDFYRDVQSWVKSINLETAVIELKLCKKEKMNVKEVKPHQISSLLAASNSILSYKIPDVGVDQKPFDICHWNRCYAYVAIIFYIPRKPKNIYLININDYIRISSKKKSISQEDCLEVSTRHARF